MSETQQIATVPEEQPNSLLAIIERAARDPSVDVAKLEKLMELAERVRSRDAKTAYYAALSAMQDELPAIVERGKIDIGKGNPQPYALWEDINRTIKPIMKAHGFALSFKTGMSEAKITVTGILSHSAGHAEETTIHLPADTSGSKNAVQAVGSSTSYGKRYTAGALLNLTSTGEDDNGKTGGGILVSDEQIATLQGLIKQYGANEQTLLEFYKTESLETMRAKDFDNAVARLHHKYRGKKP